MNKAAERSPVSLQLWPRGACVTVSGEGPEMEVKIGRDGEWRAPTTEERHEIRTEQLAEMYADRDVLHCDSSLVSDLLQASASGELSGDLGKEWDYENIQNHAAGPDDWTLEQCKEWLDDNGYDLPSPDPWTMDRSELVEALEGVSIECRDDETDETLRAAVIANMDDETIDGLDDYRDLVRDNAYEHEAEIYEWWRVSSWLAKQLAHVGECVLDNAYGEWWGRTCTGQGYIMDGTLQKVAQRFVY